MRAFVNLYTSLFVVVFFSRSFFGILFNLLTVVKGKERVLSMTDQLTASGHLTAP